MTAMLTVLLIGAVLAAFSLSASLQLMALDSLPSWLGPFDIPILIIMLLPLILICKGMRNSVMKPSIKSRTLLSTLITSVALMSALSLYIFLNLSGAQPHGDWDAWAIWNLHARFIFRGGNEWHAYLNPILNWSHPDYPLMLPAAVARGWQMFGRESTLAPICIAFSFTTMTIALVSLALRFLRSRLAALIAAAVMLGTPSLIQHGASQYADITTAFFYLATFALLALREATPNKRACLYSAFTMAGCAAWTKNEGILFLVIVSITHLAITARRDGRKELLRDAMMMAAAVAPFIILLLLFKSRAPENDITAALASSWTEKAFSLSRYAAIAKAFAVEIFRINNGLAVITALALIVLGRSRIQSSPAAQVGLLTLALMSAGIFCVFLVTPNDLDWHLATALDRLFIQLWPSAVFVGFLAFDIDPSEGDCGRDQPVPTS